MNLNDCFNTMLEYGEAVKSSFVKGHVSDWSEKKEEEVVTPNESETEDPEIVKPEVTEPTDDPVSGVTEEPVEEDDF